MQNNTITPKEEHSLPIDRGEAVTLSKSDIDAIINRAVSEAAKKFEKMFIQAMGRETGKGEKWASTAAAAAILGKKPEQLRRMARDGRLRRKIEFRDDRTDSAIRPVYVFNIEKCEQRLLTPPEKRGGNK